MLTIELGGLNRRYERDKGADLSRNEVTARQCADVSTKRKYLSGGRFNHLLRRVRQADSRLLPAASRSERYGTRRARDQNV